MTATYLPCKDNTLADKESQVFHDNTEWMLNETVFKQCLDMFPYHSEIDLFASRLNARLPKYISWKPDPGVLYVDAFQVCWKDFKCYAFPPFSVIDSVAKTSERQSAGSFHSATLDNSALVSEGNENVCVTSLPPSMGERSVDITCSRSNSSSLFKTTVNSLSPVRDIYPNSGFSQSAVSIIMNSWRGTTKNSTVCITKNGIVTVLTMV